MSTLLRAAFGAALLLTGACALAQAPATPPPIVATQETNVSGVVADVTEFRRKGNTLTAKVRFRNTGTADAEINFEYTAAYLLDTEAGKKYEVLKDEKGTCIAALYTGYPCRYWVTIKPGAAQTAWMKFPAPPAATRSVTLQVPVAPPFEDLPIQDP